MKPSGVLAGRRVVVTRAVEQSAELVALLEQSGAVAVVVPLIEIATEPAGVVELAALNLAAFDWVVVTSPNGARHLVDAAASSQRKPSRVAAVGSTTAAVLIGGGLSVSLTPAVQSAHGLLVELAAGGLAADDLPFSKKVLVVQAAAADPALAAGLRARGCEVSTVAPYRTVAVQAGVGLQLAALAADAVLFASGSAVRAWVDVFGDSTPPIVVTIGPQTAEAATRAGLKVSVVAADHSLSGMVAALERRLAVPN
ncbi:MAG: uroporphyrinogen-III synthase [Actinobacteria bacterium]|nr:uroporphyrinogen-III synthase [Actinomycetota bacterium]